MSEIKPSDIKSIYQTFEKLERWGIEEYDIILLIQNHISPRPSKEDVKRVLKAIKYVEENILKKIEIGIIHDMS